MFITRCVDSDTINDSHAAARGDGAAPVRVTPEVRQRSNQPPDAAATKIILVSVTAIIFSTASAPGLGRQSPLPDYRRVQPNVVEAKLSLA